MKQVLIVDDSQEDLDILSKVMEKDGWVINTASDGAQALDRLVNNGFSLILIDIRMPTLSGYDLLRLMREKINHSAKMIYVSIVPEKEVDIGDADGFIQKPFSPESILKVVNQVMEK